MGFHCCRAGERSVRCCAAFVVSATPGHPVRIPSVGCFFCRWVYRDDADTRICSDVLAGMARGAVAVPWGVFSGIVSFVPPSELARSGPAQKRVRITGAHDSEGIIGDARLLVVRLLAGHHCLQAGTAVGDGTRWVPGSRRGPAARCSGVTG